MPGVLEGTFFTIFFLYGLAAISLPLSHRLFARNGVLLRWLAALVFGATFLTLSFQLLLAISLFNRHAAAAVIAVAIVGMQFAGLGHARLRDAIHRDVEVCARWIASVRSRPVQAFYMLVLFAAAVTVARSLMLPTVGWDSITYHYVKAGMWVQSGGPITLDAPGGWSMYRAIFGGGEIFTAWSMLPFHNDLLAGLVDLVWWGCCGLALVAIAREFGIRARHRVVMACYAVFLPAAWDAVGWGYVDLAYTALQLVGLLFGIRALRTKDSAALLVSLLALGLASNVKLSAVPFAVAVGGLLLIDVLRQPLERISRARMLAIGVMASVLFLAPWLANNYSDTGYPLRFPVNVAGIQLGAENAAFGWSQARDLPAFTFGAEIEALGRVFPVPTVNESHLSVLTLPMLLLALVGFVRVMWTRQDLRGAQVLVIFLAGSVLLAYFNPAFSYTRLGFTWVNGRFLFPLVCVALPFAIAIAPQQAHARDWVAWLFAGALLVHFACFLPDRLENPDPTLIVIGTSLFLAGAVALGVLVRRTMRIDVFGLAGAALATALVLFILVIALDRLHEPDRRYLLLGKRNVSADVFRYWWQSAHLAESKTAGHRIAVTAGPRQDADNWLMYYFLGRNLQNTLHYVPISRDGDIIPFGPDELRKQQGDYATWLNRLDGAQISHVFSFFPSSVELLWMDAHPERFERLRGDGVHWAFFRARGRTPERAPNAKVQSDGALVR